MVAQGMHGGAIAVTGTCVVKYDISCCQGTALSLNTEHIQMRTDRSVPVPALLLAGGAATGGAVSGCGTYSLGTLSRGRTSILAGARV